MAIEEVTRIGDKIGKSALNPIGITKSDLFFYADEIDPKRWKGLYPYRLLVVDVSDGIPQPVGMAKGESGDIATVKAIEGIDYVLNQQIIRSSVRAITLPITPQQLQIADQFAINTSATMRGIVEEHGGIRFKLITMSGTTGIYPTRPTKDGKISPVGGIAGNLKTIFGGTLEAAGGFLSSAKAIGNTFSGNHPNKIEDEKNPSDKGSTNELLEFSTGYYQALSLAQFLEQYAIDKKHPAAKGYRLVLDIPKQKQSFIVTPVSFSLNQSQQRPNEILFNLQLKAWKRIDLNLTAQAASSELPRLDANTFQRIVRTINATRQFLGQSINLVKAVRSDALGVFNNLRQTTLILKDISGLALTLADLPNQLIKGFNDTIASMGADIKLAQAQFTEAKGITNKYLNKNKGGSSGAASQSGVSSIAGAVTSSSSIGDIVDAATEDKRQNEGLSNSAVKEGALGEEAADRAKTSPSEQASENPEGNIGLYDGVNVDDANPSLEQQLAIEDELNRVRLLTVNDFRIMREDLFKLALEISNRFGAGDETFSYIYNLPEPSDRATPLTVEENEILSSIFETLQAYDLLTSTKLFDDLTIENPLEFVGGLANEAGINFEDYPSKLLVPVPFGVTIEELAARYMGDSSKWLEIVTLNSLRSPYIDEDGFILSLLSNAEGRQFNVNDENNGLFVGQRIILQSDAVQQFVRKIINLEKIGEGNFLVTVDGLGDLDNLKTIDNARIQGFLPGTVNSQNQIYIPSSAPSEEDDRTFEITHLDEPNLTKVSKIDFLLTEDFDIALNSVGDFRLANGLTNLIQALKLKIKTQKGTILRHLDYGVGLDHGVSVADIEGGAIINSLNQMIESDPRFSEISRISLRLNGATLSVDMAVTIANNSGIVPVTFKMRVS